MTSKKILPVTSSLRIRAESKLAKARDTVTNNHSEDTQKLLHELQVHQIELEMQNENLKLAQEQAESAMEAYKQLYDFAPVGYLTLDADGYIVDINLTAAAMLGFERSKIVKHLFSHYFVSSHLFDQHLQEAYKHNNNVVSELKIRRANKGVLDIQLESRVMVEASGLRGHIHSIMTDISARKSLELMVQTKQVEVETMLKQQVAALTASAIAHELNQPLASINAYSEVALHTIANKPEDIEGLQNVLKSNITQVQRAGKILHDMIALLRNVQLELAPMDINNCLNKAISSLRSLGHSEVKLDLFLDQDLSLVLGNHLQVEKVFLNLFLNSIEAMKLKEEPIGNVEIKVSIVKIEKMVNVTVQDAGPGFDDISENFVFTPFFSSKETMGLGLAISRSIIEACGGKLWLDKNINSGAIFHFTLPLAPELKA